MNYKLKKSFPDLNEGAVFSYNDKIGLYVHSDYSFKKETVEKNPDWFEVANELQK